MSTMDEKLESAKASSGPAQRTRKSLLDARGYKGVVGKRGDRLVIMLASGTSTSFWMCSSGSDQERPATLYEQVRPTVKEHVDWVMTEPTAEKPQPVKVHYFVKGGDDAGPV
jgi:hypothetical protein